MAYKRTTWTEKYEKETTPRFVECIGKMAGKFGEGKMLIATPKLIDELIRQIPKGRLTTINAIRNKLAQEFNVDVTCPITTGIFTWIVAHKTEEDRAKGMNRKDLSPYWRVIKEDGALNPKYPGGETQQTEYLNMEGFILIPNRTGKKLMIKDFKHYLFNY